MGLLLPSAARKVYDTLSSEADRLDYEFWPTNPAKPYDLFLFGLRAPTTSTNLFDDVIGVARLTSDGPSVYVGAATTDPGRTALDHPTRKAGTATVVPGQVRGLWGIGLHQGRYAALTQATGRPGVVVPVWRGRGRDTVYSDAAGINLHRASTAAYEDPEKARVDWYSAGCQVFRDAPDLAAVLALAYAQVNSGSGKTFSYTLFDARSSPALAEVLLG